MSKLILNDEDALRVNTIFAGMGKPTAVDHFPYRRPIVCLNQDGVFGVSWEGAYSALQYDGRHFRSKVQIEKDHRSFPEVREARAIELKMMEDVLANKVMDLLPHLIDGDLVGSGEAPRPRVKKQNGKEVTVVVQNTVNDRKLDKVVPCVDGNGVVGLFVKFAGVAKIGQFVAEEIIQENRSFGSRRIQAAMDKLRASERTKLPAFDSLRIAS